MPADIPTQAEMRSNAARVKAILAQQKAHLQGRGQNKTPQEEADLARIEAAISSIDAAWQPTTQAQR